jgi:hypothetical protein
MASRRASLRRAWPVELRLAWWLVKLTCSVVARLPLWLLGLLGTLLWLLAWPLRARPQEPAWPAADAFYRSQRWRRLRIDALEANRARHGALCCECCRTGASERWHVDHIRPRSSHPALALEPTNLQVLCADCNRGKGTRYATDWRGAHGA